jgi:hypothetical protein
MASLLNNFFQKRQLKKIRPWPYLRAFVFLKMQLIYLVRKKKKRRRRLTHPIDVDSRCRRKIGRALTLVAAVAVANTSTSTSSSCLVVVVVVEEIVCWQRVAAVVEHNFAQLAKEEDVKFKTKNI